MCDNNYKENIRQQIRGWGGEYLKSVWYSTDKEDRTMGTNCFLKALLGGVAKFSCLQFYCKTPNYNANEARKRREVFHTQLKYAKMKILT